MEKQSIPTATLCTDEFAALAKQECASLGLPEMPLIILPHPISALLDEDAQVIALEAANEVIHVLTRDAEKLAAEYNEKKYPMPRRTVRAKQVFS